MRPETEVAWSRACPSSTMSPGGPGRSVAEIRAKLEGRPGGPSAEVSMWLRQKRSASLGAVGTGGKGHRNGSRELSLGDWLLRSRAPTEMSSAAARL